jgi:hypothetical protein
MISAGRTGAGVAAHDTTASAAAMNQSRAGNRPATTSDVRSALLTTLTSLGREQSIEHATRFHR